MTLRLSDQRGFTLFEMMVVLAIVAIVFAAALTARGWNSSGRLLAAEVADILEMGATHRLSALTSGTAVGFRPASKSLRIDGCGTAETEEILFLPDGSARGEAFCLHLDGRSVRVTPDWLTGQLVTEQGR
ncbi:MAG: prepilin-type N-terminal cleavage/methylation domain-containing protein [Pseudomonadota bacterium]